jgi:exosortase
MILRDAVGTAYDLRRHVLFGCAILASFVLFHSPLSEVARLSLRDESYSHIMLMPILAVSFLFWKRNLIFSDVRYSPVPGAMCMGLGILCGFGFSRWFNLNQDDRLALSMSSALLVWTGAFIGCYGWRTFKKALFSFLLLLFVIPLPGFLARTVLAVLQRCSVETVYPVLRAVGLSVTRDGYILHFPNMSIKIAEACAGFHSLLALLIISMIGAKLLLHKGWTRTVAVVAIIPIVIIKNALRIIVISLVVVYLGENAFVGVFHKLVGFTFFALLLLWLVMVVLRRLEARTARQRSGPETRPLRGESL